MKTDTRQLILSFLVLSFAASIAGCNTMRGAGEDIEEAGEEIQEEVEDHD